LTLDAIAGQARVSTRTLSHRPSLITPIEAVRAWAEQNAERILAAEVRYDRGKR
jgi:hypothetical protein